MSYIDGFVNPVPADGRRMIYGGFAALLETQDP